MSRGNENFAAEDSVSEWDEFFFSNEFNDINNLESLLSAEFGPFDPGVVSETSKSAAEEATGHRSSIINIAGSSKNSKEFHSTKSSAAPRSVLDPTCSLKQMVPDSLYQGSVTCEPGTIISIKSNVAGESSSVDSQEGSQVDLATQVQHTRISQSRENSTYSAIPRLTSTTRLGSKDELIKFNLLSLAQAFATNDQESISHYFSVLKPSSNPLGSAMERLAHYFMRSLVARQNGSGAACCKALSVLPGDPMAVHSFYKRLSPKVPISYVTILAVVDEVLELFQETASVLHFVDILGYPTNWIPFFRLVRCRFHKISQIKITLVLFLDDNLDHNDRSPEAALPFVKVFAESMGFSPVFRVFRCKLREFKLSEHKITGETLVVNCGIGFSQIPDSSVLHCNPRDTIIQVLNEAEPDLVLLSGLNFDLNTQFFLKRFRAAMDSCYVLLSMLERVYANVEDLLNIERSIFMRKIMNVVACEGLDRFMRSEDVHAWRKRFLKAGFALKPMRPGLLQKLQSEVTRFGKGVKVEAVDGVMHVSWNSVPILFHSTWRMRR